MYVCYKKTLLFTVIPLKNCHKMALYHSVLQFIFFEGCPESRVSLLLSAIPWVSNNCTADKNIMVTGCVA